LIFASLHQTYKTYRQRITSCFMSALSRMPPCRDTTPCIRMETTSDALSQVPQQTNVVVVLDFALLPLR
jgi:hypothetical protein